MRKPTGPIQHVVIIVKENHTFDNYFGRFPGVDGDPNLAPASDPPSSDHPHEHAAWLKRATGAAREQYAQANIPNYWRYAQRYTLCDRYFTEVAGPSTPNHLMLIAANSPIIDNPHYRDPIRDQPPFDIASLPAKLAKAGLTWRNYGGYAHGYITALKGSKNQVDAVVKGGLWANTVIFITWDDWGGWYDHVTPPLVEKWTDGTQFRYGSRVGCLVLSPYARTGYISHTQHSHVSLVKFCEKTFGLQPINARDRAADDMSDCFDFRQKPLSPPPPAI
ncbi:MAG: hypothetical protein E6I99_13375 [Chloroflexi bacterium]|nr:MAG: hypothetical protein E6I99_13375 [Chloroflexota bacterium]